MTTWATEYKDAPSTSLDGKIYVAACSIVHRLGESARHERISRAIGQIAFDQGVCIWHACSVYWGRLDRCPCSPCRKAGSHAA